MKKMRASSVFKKADFLQDIYRKKSDFWKKNREKQLLETFRLCAEKVPAYRDFLKKNGIDSKKILTIKDFNIVPPVNKKNYLRQYPLEKLCMGGTLTQHLVFTSTSGSTGSPFYFPRNDILDQQFSEYCELFLKNNNIGKDSSTLVIVCLGMGVWIGGLITYQAFKLISGRGYPLAILTPGVNKKEIYEAMRTIAPKFDRVILCGYPPFMKDLVDEAESNGVDWKKHDIKMIFAAESFSEKFRDYIAQKTGMKNPHLATMNVYGSADLGGMAEESPISILIRRLALKHKKIYKKLFNQATRLPTFAQFNPYFVNFEAVDNPILCTAHSALPLVRYEIGDNGNVIDFSEVEGIFREFGVDLRREAEKAGISDTITELPFVCVYERTDFAAKLYGAFIYPEYVKGGLQHAALEKYLTGKFTMSTKHDANENEYLEVNIELKKEITVSKWLKKEVVERISDSLLEKSAEHKNNANVIPDKVRPRVVFWAHEHPTHFQPGIKQKWFKKEDTAEKTAKDFKSFDKKSNKNRRDFVRVAM